MLSSKSPYFLKNFEYNGMRKLTSSIVSEQKPTAIVSEQKPTTIVSEQKPTTIVSEQKPKTIMKKKDQIPKKVKEEVWNKYIGDDIPKHLCLCCKLNRIKIFK